MSSQQPGSIIGQETKPKASTAARSRRTLQSGFSLLARGEPKIWLTGGALVTCLAMIVGLLGLIVTSGLATFWPRSIEWLVLSDNKMDIGEPQRRELREVSTTGSTKSVDPTAETSRAAVNSQSSSAPSYFYRTGNFDVTNRHYRWFEPGELTETGITRPQWALVIERLAWGRMFGLPARLSLPITIEPSELHQTWALINELSAELEGIATANSLPWSDIKLAIERNNERERTGLLRKGISAAIADAHVISHSGKIQVQSAEMAAWQNVADAASATDVTAMNSEDSLFAARIVYDSPQAILDRVEPILLQKTQQRQAVEHTMHSISRLDAELAEARIRIRQAELDTNRTVLDKVEALGPIIEGLVAQEFQTQRIKACQARAAKDIDDTKLQAAWQTLLSKYATETIDPVRSALANELQTWQEQFAQEPEPIRQSLDNFIQVWRSILERKRPLEQSIPTVDAPGQEAELSVLLPADAVTIELPAESAPQIDEALLSGKWTDAAKSALSAHNIVIAGRAPSIEKFGPHLQAIHVEDDSRGLVTLWRVQRDNGAPTWLMPSMRQVPCSEIVRLFPANRLSLAGKLSVYLSRWREFLLESPREANTEGGVFPAIWGTVVMTLIMTLAVVPFGVIAALYLREYTRSGPIVSLVRISINNLAGVPSIVYGVFGLAFFCYSIGAFIDGGAHNAQFGVLPGSTWYLVLSGTVCLSVLAFALSFLSGGQDRTAGPWRRRIVALAPWVWLLSLSGIAILVFKSPFFDGLYEARLPAPTFGKEGLLWASFTLALLTLPVVIVATEEALSAVPNSLREGSLACGASKWQTIYRIVLPHARPGILTGAILAMARGIGEVAPLMLVGALPVAPDLPLDSEFPYFHGSRSFMHLGYQIYWLGFQSQNSEASKPLVFTCTLLLILIVISLNLSAILLRARLRKRFQGNQF